jgi:hypothetical protein
VFRRSCLKRIGESLILDVTVVLRPVNDVTVVLCPVIDVLDLGPHCHRGARAVLLVPYPV